MTFTACTPAQAATLYLEHGMMPVPCHPRTKKPVMEDWTAFRVDQAATGTHFPGTANIGLLLGTTSRGLVDADLDTTEARVTAPAFLPVTGWISGRQGSPRSHFWYIADAPPEKASSAFKDIDGTMILELRSTGGQTVAPPSIHPTGEPIIWHQFDRPAAVPMTTLGPAVKKAAAAALLARHWPKQGSRQEAALALAGTLLMAKWNQEATEHFIRVTARAANDEEHEKRASIVGNTADRIAKSQAVTGLTRLAELTSKEVTAKVREWLEIATAHEHAATPWPDPIIPESDPDVAPFPLQVFPATVATLVREIAGAVSAPVDYVATPLLSIAGGLIANSRRLQIKRGHRQSACLWTVTVGVPGTAKSPAQEALKAPVVRIQGELLADFRAALEKWEKEGEGKDSKKSRGPKPAPRELYVDNTTQETLSFILGDNPRGLALIKDEVSGLMTGMNQYKRGQGDDRQFFLSLWASDAIKVNRKSEKAWNGAPLFIPDPFVSITGGIQPSVVHKIRGRATDDDGLSDRFLFAYPKDPPAEAENWREIPPASTAAWADIVRKLYALEMVPTEDGDLRPFIVNLDPSGKEAWERFTREHAGEVNSPDFNQSLRGPWAKLRGYCARIALVLHELSYVTGETRDETRLAGTTVDAAAELIRYFKSHLRKVMAAMDGDQARPGVLRALGWIQRHQKERFQKRDLYHALRSSFPTVRQLDPVLAGLVDQYIVRPVETTGRQGRGQPKSPFFETNPAVLLRAQKSQNTQNSPEPAPTADFPAFSEEAQNCAEIANSSAEFPEPLVDVYEDDPENPGFDPDDDPEAPGPGTPKTPTRDASTPASGPSEGILRVENPILRNSAREGENGSNPHEQRPEPNSALSANSAPIRVEETPSPFIAVDIETTGLDPRDGACRLVSVTDEKGTQLVDLFKQERIPDLSGRPLAFHNAAFDLSFLSRLGVEPSAVFDTMLMSQLLYAGRQERVRLQDCVGRELGITLDKTEQESDWTGSLTEGQLTYARRDSAVLLPLAEKLAAKIKDAQLTRTAQIENQAVPAMVWLRASGVGIDVPRWRAELRRLEQEASDLEARLDSAAPRNPNQLVQTGWNWKSSQQCLEALTLAGCSIEDTADETLAQANHPLAETLREYRSAQKLVSSYGGDWLKENVFSGRVYPDWRQLGSVAGRMSCKNPNFQQIPQGELRHCVIARPGHVLVKADYSQIELRIAAKISGDQVLAGLYAANDDVHTRTAQALTGKPGVTKQDRQLAKAVNFGLLYGMGAKGLKAYAKTGYGVTMTLEEAERYRNAFFETYPGIATWHTTVKRRKPTETRTLFGRRRFIARDEAITHALNTPVQGTGADGLKIALATLWRTRNTCPASRLVLVVHDEIVLEVPEQDAQIAESWLRTAMVSALEEALAPIPVTVETQISRTWGGRTA